MGEIIGESPLLMGILCGIVAVVWLISFVRIFMIKMDNIVSHVRYKYSQRPGKSSELNSGSGIRHWNNTYKRPHILRSFSPYLYVKRIAQNNLCRIPLFLRLIQSRIFPFTLRNQFPMSANLYNLPVFHNHNSVSQLYGAEAVCDNDGSLIL